MSKKVKIYENSVHDLQQTGDKKFGSPKALSLLKSERIQIYKVVMSISSGKLLSRAETWGTYKNSRKDT